MTLKELHKRQGWTLSQKIDHALGTIEDFESRMGGKTYVAFSGGKDSTVLLHLCRIIRPDIPAVFSNTGCELPDIVKFVRCIASSWGNVITIRPDITPRVVWEKYGFPIASKEIAKLVHTIRGCPDGETARKGLGEGRFALRKRWKYLIDAPYEVSSICCDKLKKQPSHRFERETGLKPYIGIMASESHLREVSYIRRGGCNYYSDGGGYY